MKLKFVMLLATLWLGSSLAYGQNVTLQNPHKCLSAEHESMHRSTNPNKGTKADFERWMAPLVEEYQANYSSNKIEAVQVIPVVFHVIHNGESAGNGINLSQNQINSQLNQLNSDFRNGADADTEIEFCAAQFEPNGTALAEPGINRIDRNAQGWSAPPYGKCRGFNVNLDYIENTIKPQSQWNPDRYLNIWVMPLNCGVLGYAQFPDQSGLPGLNSSGGAASTDGVVVDVTTVGATNNPNPLTTGPYRRGRTASHEVGHWLGLRHIWGDGGCSVDDFCADTPLSDGPNYGCPNTVSCGSTDQVENFMDYTDDVCMDRFTNDQKARMQVVMANSPRRTVLASSTACTTGGDDGTGGGGGGGGGNGNGNGNGNGSGMPKRVDMTDLLANLEAFPNPATSDIRLQFTSVLEGQGQIQVVDLVGRVMLQADINIERGGNSVSLDLNGIPVGAYLLVLKQGETAQVHRISKIQ